MKSKDVLNLLKVSRITLSRYVREGKIRTITLPNGYYNYNEDDVYALAGLEAKRDNVIYARVSTNKQKQELENQINNAVAYLNAKGIKVDKIYQKTHKKTTASISGR